MKMIILILATLILSSCASKVLVKHSSCEKILDDVFKCEEIK